MECPGLSSLLPWPLGRGFTRRPRLATLECPLLWVYRQMAPEEHTLVTTWWESFSLSAREAGIHGETLSLQENQTDATLAG